MDEPSEPTETVPDAAAPDDIPLASPAPVKPLVCDKSAAESPVAPLVLEGSVRRHVVLPLVLVCVGSAMLYGGLAWRVVVESGHTRLADRLRAAMRDRPPRLVRRAAGA